MPDPRKKLVGRFFMEQSEKKVLAIIAIVIGAIALISSWMPFINNGSFVIAIIALIIGVFALFFNRKRKKNTNLC